QQLLNRDSLQFTQAADRVLDQVVGAGCPGGDADGDFSRRQPVAGRDFLLLVEVVMNDELVGDHLGGVLDEIGCQDLLAHLGKVRSVGRVVAADHDQQ